MERLTERGADGSGWDTRCRHCDEFFKSPCLECGERGKLFNRLADYEDSGLMPEEFDSDIIQNAYDELAEYEVAEEQGRLIKLPFTFGNIIYEISESRPEIFEWTIKGFQIFEDATYICVNDYTWINVTKLGKTIFRTLDEARAKLKEMERDNAL